MVRQHLIEQLRAKIIKFPRVPLAYLPTPLEDAPRLSAVLGGPRILFKRDDLTGLAFGGNKTRMLEFELAEALARGADTIVAGSAAQSNYLRQLAAACSKLGLDAYFLASKARGDKDLEIQGNLFLDLLLGVHVRIIEEDVVAQGRLGLREALAEELRAQGRTVYIAWWDSTYLNTISYVSCALEIVEQLQRLGLHPDYLYVASGDATQAGLEVGFRYLEASISVVGFNPEHWVEDARPAVASFANEAARHLGINSVLRPEDVSSTNDYIGGQYSLSTRASREAIELVARTEGIFLDPVYSGRAMAGLVDHIRGGRLAKQDVVVFLHTGGSPALFAYHDDFHELCQFLSE